MFQNIGFTEILLIGIVALVLFGPQKLPEIGKVIGRTLNEFKKGARELMEEVKTEPSDQASAEPLQKPAAAQAEASDRKLPVAAPEAKEQTGDVLVSQEEKSAAVSAEAKPDAPPPRSPARRLPD